MKNVLIKHADGSIIQAAFSHGQTDKQVAAYAALHFPG